jgi:D-arabinose 1-dehydrogenase-like Zn-dependent alcohol dehydrogenase
MPLNGYLSLLKRTFPSRTRFLFLPTLSINFSDLLLFRIRFSFAAGGQLILVGLPEAPFPNFHPSPLIMSNVSMGGSLIGAPNVIREMLDLAAKQNVKSWIEKVPMDQVNKAVVDMHNSKARYRYVLCN